MALKQTKLLKQPNNLTNFSRKCEAILNDVSTN